ncbi:hypothetical protein LS69_010040 [Helicobacter sp. MIT 05-5294]|nr:hypothetical protein LS69_010040 [Helicobacter sp. MIT 05-5294]
MYVHYKLDTRTRIEHFFAQSVVECGTTLELQENFNYSIESLLNDNRFTKEQAEKYGYQKNNGIYIQRANKIHIGRIKYNGRYGNMPNTDDGYNFSGKGLFHLTFRVNYRDFTIKAREWGWIGEDIDFEANPKLLFEDGNYALMSATYFWKHNQCFANANDNTKLCADSITRIINRYTGSYQERWNQYERIRNAEIFKEF